ncbi:MAG: hypothetical protein IPJ34_01560 [Myxococcales bacterium]|nr:hypothetical protein [Myxococcales bacterium]
MELLHAAIAHVGRLAPSLSIDVTVQPRTRGGEPASGDAVLVIRRPKLRAATRFLVETKTTHLSYALVDGVLGRYAKLTKPWLLCAPYVAPPMAAYLIERGANFIDATGNCHLTMDGDVLLHHVERRRIESGVVSQAVRAPGYAVLFALLARPELLDEPLRVMELHANATKSTVSNQLRRLEAEGILARSRGRLHLVRPSDLFDRFVTGYANVLRPRLFVGRYATPWGDPQALEERIEREFTPSGERSWWWGGASGCWRLTKHYRPSLTTLHVTDLPTSALRQLRALPSPTGNLEVLRVPGPTATEGADSRQGAVHPLLLYAEMMVSPDERTREAATALREEQLTAFS